MRNICRCMEERTGAKQSEEDQLFGLRLPSTTIWYFALSGYPFSSFLIINIAIAGKAFPKIAQSS